MSVRAYQRWEAGGGITWGNLERIAAVHQLPVAELLAPRRATRGIRGAGASEALAPAPIRREDRRDDDVRALARRLDAVESRLASLLELALEIQLELAAAPARRRSRGISRADGD